MLDHVYTNNPALVNLVTFDTPLFDDHVLILVNLNMKSPTVTEKFQMRNWSGYLKEVFANEVYKYLLPNNIDWQNLSVQEHWNSVELLILENLEKCAPVIDVKTNRN